jgi:DNA polymerase-3 subunit gamma/tau
MQNNLPFKEFSLLFVALWIQGVISYRPNRWHRVIWVQIVRGIMTETHSQSYQVLARKYRPETFTDLVGQNAMVQTLKNAFAADRIAQAFIMTGIRGTGKTTTARIIAKGLNCTGPDGSGGATTDPCGVCDACSAIMQGRHVDVMEMDAASRTGVGDIREIIDSVHYRAASARYKIYIIDEVHMLSTSAFNALLKTLEEPPAHVKFIFATTEIRKVPVTVLSRCQRFDLRRIEPEVMIALTQRIADAEGAKITGDALALITRAAEGSARDATSLLDQAISHGAGETTAEQVRAMLGLADRSRVMDLFDMVMKGDAHGALNELSAQYADGADPMAVLKDLAEITHWISVVQITPDAADDPTLSPDQRSRGQSMAQALPMRVLTRMWQMLLKALDEVSQAPNAMMAAEMALIRLTHVADMPSPDELIRKLQSTPPPPAPAPPTGPTQAAPRSQPASGQKPNSTSADGGGSDLHGATGSNIPSMTDGPQASVQQASAPPAAGTTAVRAVAVNQAQALYPTFEHVIELIRLNRDVKLLVEVETGVQLAKYQPGRIEFVPTETAPQDLAQRLGQRLQLWTGNRWAVSVVNEGGTQTIAAKRDKAENALKAEAETHPLVQAVLTEFPKARITQIRTPDDIAEAAHAERSEELV